MKYVYIANRADEFMQADIAGFPNEKTGGILLGYRHDEDQEFEVLEAVDGGVHAIHEKDIFSCDAEYVQHLADLLSRLYYPRLQVVGVWCKHDQVCDPPFSDEDVEMQKKVLEYCKESIVSILFQKLDEDEYMMKAFAIDENGSYKEIDMI